MPVACPHFRHLTSRVATLAAKFVDDQLRDESANPGTFQPDLDRLAAFRLLVHSEIEDFLEAKARANIDAIGIRMAAGPTWMRQSPELLSLAIGLGRSFPEADRLELNQHSTFVDELLRAARRAIGENNGVKTSSFVLLSLCAGKTIDEVDGALSSSLNSYGKKRGDVAHKSVARSTSLQAPSAEASAAHSLVTQLGTYFDVCP